MTGALNKTLTKNAMKLLAFRLCVLKFEIKSTMETYSNLTMETPEQCLTSAQS